MTTSIIVIGAFIVFMLLIFIDNSGRHFKKIHSDIIDTKTSLEQIERDIKHISDRLAFIEKELENRRKFY